MAILYWGGGTGTWDSSSTTNWYSDSARTTLALSAPTLDDVVIFDSDSSPTSYTVTISTGAVSKDWLVSGPASGNVTFAGSSGISIYGGVSWTSTGITRTYTGTITFPASTGTFNLNFGGISLENAIIIGNATSSTAIWNLTASLSSGSNSGLTVRTGTFKTQNYSLLLLSLNSNSSLSRTIDLGTSTVTLQGLTPINIDSVNLTLSAENSSINCTQYQDQTINLGSGTQWNSITFSSGKATFGASGPGSSVSINSLTSNYPFLGTQYFYFSAADLWNIGTFTLPSGQPVVKRTIISAGGSDTLNTTLNINNLVNFNNIDFHRITAQGFPTWGDPTWGDAGGNSGIVFSPSKTLLYGVSWIPTYGIFDPNNTTARWVDTAPVSATLITLNLQGAASLTPDTIPDFVGNYGSEDDAYYQIDLPWTISYLGVNYTTIFISTNSYVTFGTKPIDNYDQTINWTYGNDTPPIPKLMIKTEDGSAQRIYYGIEGTSPNRTYRIRYEGDYRYNAGTLGSPTVLWELTFFEAVPNQFELHVGQHQESSSLFGVYSETEQVLSLTGNGNDNVAYRVTTNNPNTFGSVQAGLFPRAHDNIVFDNNSLSDNNLLVFEGYGSGSGYVKSINFSARTNILSVDWTRSPIITGDLKLSSAVSYFAGFGVNIYPHQSCVIDCAGSTALTYVTIFARPVGTTVTLNSAFYCSNLSIFGGTINTNNYNLSVNSLSVSPGGNLVFNSGSSVITCRSNCSFSTGAGIATYNTSRTTVVFNLTGGTNGQLTSNAGSLGSPSAIRYILAGSGTGYLRITSVETTFIVPYFESVRNAAWIQIPSTHTVTFNYLKIAANKGNRAQLGSASNAAASINYGGTGTVNLDYVDIYYLNAVVPNKFYAGKNGASIGGTNTNWVFNSYSKPPQKGNALTFLS